MKKHSLIANWKSYKTSVEAKNWLEGIAHFNFPPSEEVETIICPPYTLLPQMHAFIQENHLPLKLGVQDVSQFGEGSYTAAINVKQAADFATHAIIGHSERRKHFHETDTDVLTKVKLLLEQQLTPILCISDMKQLQFYLEEDKVLVENADRIIFVYEPPGAISGGGAFHAEDADSANKNAGQISEMIGKSVMTLYGGSVNPDNARELFAKENIHGGLIGQASLDAEKFIKLIESA